MVDLKMTRENIHKLPKFDESSADVSHPQKRKSINKLLLQGRLKLAFDGNLKFEDFSCEPMFCMNKDTYNPSTHVMVRLLCNRELPIDFDTGIIKLEQILENNRSPREQDNGNYIQRFWSQINEYIRPKVKQDTVIIHVHGGGFVAMSSSSHQCYTRMWANELGVPIISVDYRLAPQNQFPDALNDVWQVYYWVVEYGEAFLGIKTDKIILVGDSAGGNLVTATTIMAIERGFRKPDMLVLAYPALSLSKFRFTPSLLLAVDDTFLPYSFLKMCLESYSGDYSSQP